MAEENAPEKKRGPGRPSKAEQAAKEAAANGQPVFDGAELPPSEKPKAKGRAKYKGPSDEEIASRAMGIQGLHLAAAKMFGLPEIAINSGEAQALAVSLDEVQREFGFAVSGKTGAVIGLLVTAGMIYGPRLLAIRERAEKARAEADAAAQSATLDALQANGIPAAN